METNRRGSLRFFFSSGRRHTRFSRDWSSDVCSSDLPGRSPPAYQSRIWICQSACIFSAVLLRGLVGHSLGAVKGLSSVYTRFPVDSSQNWVSVAWTGPAGRTGCRPKSIRSVPSSKRGCRTASPHAPARSGPGSRPVRPSSPGPRTVGALSVTEPPDDLGDDVGVTGCGPGHRRGDHLLDDPGLLTVHPGSEPVHDHDLAGLGLLREHALLDLLIEVGLQNVVAFIHFGVSADCHTLHPRNDIVIELVDPFGTRTRLRHWCPGPRGSPHRVVPDAGFKWAGANTKRDIVNLGQVADQTLDRVELSLGPGATGKALGFDADEPEPLPSPDEA